ncbi:hypothetical protein SAMN00768000_0915 [Sulfobacillus thermosulfidooxidans DSM 9293]|uniref:HAD family phosphatase n=2 Tax=Sulfobacillus thermosulfidooxidans TaxID=28034 RepID=A0A1W1WA05_SULTA|nr:hypothetical protein SAMN00768000_0915 [Sulfobacillus thermosulfidooxidans DSM 9293]
MIQMIACDLDGTLLNQEIHVQPKAAQLLRQLWHNGIHVIIATGRSWRTALKAQQELGITGAIVAHNGAYVFDPSKHPADLYRHGIPRPRAQEMFEWSFRHQAHMRFYLGYQQPVLLTRLPDDYDRWQKPSDRLVSPGTVIPRQPLEILLLGQKSVDQFIQDFGLIGPDYELTIFDHGHYREVNICAPGVTKAEGLEKLAHHYHIARQNILAIGDGLNDVPMLKWAGIGIAVGQGLPECHLVADYVTPTGSDDPVTAAILWAEQQGLLGPLSHQQVF